MDSVSKLKENKDLLVQTTVDCIKTNYPSRTPQFEKCSRDLGYIMDSIIHCVEEKNIEPINHISKMFFNQGKLQLKTLHVEFEAYNKLLKEIDKVLDSQEDLELCNQSVQALKSNLANGIFVDNDNLSHNADRETRIKHILYGWDEEQEIMRNMQRCWRNWDLSKEIPYEAVDYLLWVAQNAPSKQHEAYYDVYYSTNRETIEYLYQFSWGSTHSRNPPSCWRNSQMNANLYMIFVCKTPPTMYNCNNDGSGQDSFGESRWENSIISVGMAMGLVMRAAHKMGLKTGPNKVKDLGPDYENEWEKKLGIYDEVTKTKNKKIIFGLGIGIPNEGRPRWESDDTELALGASNGHAITTRFNEPDFEAYNHVGEEKRKVRIIDIKDYAGQILEDPYGNEHKIPDAHEIKINTVRHRDIKIINIDNQNHS